MDADHLKLKAATRRLVKLAGGIEEASRLDGCRVEKSMLARYGSTNEPEAFMPADVVAALEREVGEPVVTATLAEALGYALKLAGGRDHGDVCDPLRMGAELARELGDFTGAALEAGEHVDMRELDLLIKEAEDLKIAATKVHDKLCRQKAGRAAGVRVVVGRGAE